MSPYRVGTDVGGTFTDLICVTPDGHVVLDKTPTTTDDQSTGVMNGLAELAERFGRSAGSVKTKARQLGLRKSDNYLKTIKSRPRRRHKKQA